MSRDDVEALDWIEDGPRSRRFDDVYFSAVDGLAESRLVFLHGAGLPDVWRGRKQFTVAELGFGTGLNVAALLQLWRTKRPPGGRLNIFSIEAYPITPEAAARALGAWPELAEVTAPLLHGWPRGRRGLHRIDLPGLDATLDLAIAEVEPALQRWDGAADAWFLDGFAPARNPQMWRDEVLALVAARSRPGAIAGTFTVAGQVRRGMASAGFTLDRKPGFGRKRERLEARWPGTPPAESPPQDAIILGGGIAGAALARALAAAGVACTVIDAEEPGAGASGAPAVLVTPRLDAGLGAVAQLHAQAFARAYTLLSGTAAVLEQGALQLEATPRDRDRFARIAAWDGFDPEALAARDGELWMRDALVVEPRQVLTAWLADATLCAGRAAVLERQGQLWRVLDDGGNALAEAAVVCIALGDRTAVLAPELGLRAVRGQLEHTDAIAFEGAPAAWGGYAIPTPGGGVLFGATHVRGDTGRDPRPEERARNIQSLAKGRPQLAERIAARPPQAIYSRAAVRATAADHLPLAGPIPGMEGVCVLTGLGGRGFTLAPLLAEHVVAEILGAPSPLSLDLSALLRPNRFVSTKGAATAKSLMPGSDRL